MNDAPDLKAVTQIQQGIWSKGDFAMVAGIVFNTSDKLAEALDIVPDERVLDVACGSGNGAISAARRSWGGGGGGAGSGPRPSGSTSSSSRPTPRTFPSATASST